MVFLIHVGQHMQHMQAGVWVVGSGIRDDNREEIETAVGLNSYLFSVVLQLEYKNCKIVKHYHVILGNLFQSYLYLKINHKRIAEVKQFSYFVSVSHVKKIPA